METGVKFRAYPTQEQKLILSKWMGCSRFIYNAKCEEDKYFYSLFKKALSLIGQKPFVDQKYSQFKSKELSPWLFEVPSQILRNASYRWYDAYMRFFKGLGGKPNKKSKYGRQSVWLTSELFHFKDDKLWIGTKTKPLGFLKFKAHRKFKLPKSITLSKQAGYWYISFCYDEPNFTAAEPDEVFKSFAGKTRDDIKEKSIGIDRGIAIPFALSDNSKYGFSQQQKKHISNIDRKRKKYQRRMARQEKGSKRRNKTKTKISKSYQKVTNIRQDFAHKTSTSLVNSSAEIFVVEALKISNMTKRPAKKWSDTNKRYMPNKASAKAGLNRGILSSTWSRTQDYLLYKAKKCNKVIIEVASHYSSQTCANCQHTCSSNRQSQSDFVCSSCGYQDNADYNAAKVIQQRGILAVLNQELSCVVGGTSKTKNGRGAKTKPSSKKKVVSATPNREETSKEKSLSVKAA